MNRTDTLFLLIKSMTKAEKRYFKVENANAEGGHKDYIRLFDAIDRQSVYDEGKIKKKFAGEAYFNQLPAVKIYLKRQLINSLRHFHEESSITLQLNAYMSDAEIFYKKNLFRSCLESIKKAKLLAAKHEKWLDLLKLNLLESKASRAEHGIESAEVLRGLNEEKQDCIDKYLEDISLSRVNDEVQSFLRRKGYAKTKNERKRIHAIMQQKILAKKAGSFDSELSRLVIISNCLLILGDREARIEISKQGVQHFREYPHRMKEYAMIYFYNLRELANQALSLKKYFYAEQLATELTGIYQERYAVLNPGAHILYIDLMVFVLIEKGDFKEALEYIPKLARIRQQFSDKLSPLEILYIDHLCFHIYFRNKDYRKTQHYIQQIIGATHLRLDMHAIALIANLIIQYEQREYEHLGYVWRSTYRFFVKKEILEKPEMILLNFIKKIVRINTEKQVLHELAILREEFLPYKNEPFIVSFPLIEWIDSKLLNCNLSYIVKENYLKAVSEQKK